MLCWHKKGIEITKKIVKPDGKLPFYSQVQLVESFRYLGDKLNTIGTKETLLATKLIVG